MEDKLVKAWLKDNGSGFGSGSGDGDGDGSGSGFGSGSGSGYGSGYGIRSVNGMAVYIIDGVQTIITHIKDNVAKGSIINSDLTLSPCLLVKGNGYFAHGDSLKGARDALTAKYFENMDTDKAIDEFVAKFQKGEKYKGTDFFEWHHYLTGSCLMGRESFVKNHGLSVDDYYTVDEFIKLTENDYGGDIIRQLKERYKDE